MSSTLVHLEPQTLLYDPADSTVFSFHHRVHDATDGGIYTLDQAAKAVTHDVAIGALRLTLPFVVASIRTCASCGCTDQYACGGGCSWVGPSSTCSACLPDGGDDD